MRGPERNIATPHRSVGWKIASIPLERRTPELQTPTISRKTGITETESPTTGTAIPSKEPEIRSMAALTPYPQKRTGHPEKITQYPEKMTVCHESITACPENVTAWPEKITPYPEKITRYIETITRTIFTPSRSANFTI